MMNSEDDENEEEMARFFLPRARGETQTKENLVS
jgi:hypothetical protein